MEENNQGTEKKANVEQDTNRILEAQFGTAPKIPPPINPAGIPERPLEVDKAPKKRVGNLLALIAAIVIALVIIVLYFGSIYLVWFTHLRGVAAATTTIASAAKNSVATTIK
ncbi:MAG: hypothetical protein KGH59_00605 [Candidatus Micrarchaeota archaeon]|nr:hypothetical protein [Candidatus Micrarchaeota archaeon]MDE1804272.1 hypothetical protein [Candidatus Micrarchaeota archaeon]MDE1846837.1 hypothetical protein [Candidatus Micrarchaeota archaeon]